ncbi:hypothetical protein NXS19_002706 [Fusarium pseudograminearum]|nr:hypothetical protein NXS19_002706 [Fusarium pseudograminearum]
MAHNGLSRPDQTSSDQSNTAVQLILTILKFILASSPLVSQSPSSPHLISPTLRRIPQFLPKNRGKTKLPIRSSRSIRVFTSNLLRTKHPSRHTYLDYLPQLGQSLASAAAYPDAPSDNPNGPLSPALAYTPRPRFQWSTTLQDSNTHVLSF